VAYCRHAHLEAGESSARWLSREWHWYSGPVGGRPIGEARNGRKKVQFQWACICAACHLINPKNPQPALAQHAAWEGPEIEIDGVH